jgi:putative N6-adenine-specific DNA methylase
MILLSGWEPSRPFLNPMCGSGTLAIESAMIAKGLPGGYFRNEFGFQKWPDYDPVLFEAIRRERYLPETGGFSIQASDISPDAVRASQANFASAGLLGQIRIQRSDFARWDPDEKEGLVMINPPYGERLDKEKLDVLYNMIGSRLKHGFSGHVAWIFSGNPGALKHIGLKPAKKINLFNGPIECKFYKYDLYEGSKKNVNKTNAGE